MKSIIKFSDVTARDGLQGLSKALKYESKIKLINGLRKCKFDEIEIGSLVNYKVIPTMENSLKLYNDTKKSGKKDYLLVGSKKYINDINKNNIENISLFTSASNTFNIKNINCNIDDSFNRFSDMIGNLDNRNKTNIKGYISCIGNCPYEGNIDVKNIVKVINNFHNLGVDELCIADTLGNMKSTKLENILIEILNKSNYSINDISLHLHVNHQECEWKNNIKTALKYGITKYDTTLLNLGGCPSAYNKNNFPSGNLNIVHAYNLFHNLGYKMNLDILETIKLQKELQKILSEENLI